MTNWKLIGTYLIFIAMLLAAPVSEHQDKKVKTKQQPQKEEKIDSTKIKLEQLKNSYKKQNVAMDTILVEQAK